MPTTASTAIFVIPIERALGSAIKRNGSAKAERSAEKMRSVPTPPSLKYFSRRILSMWFVTA